MADDWHAQPVTEVYGGLATGPEGLSGQEAAERLLTHGPNSLPPARGVHPVLRFLNQFNSALIYFLLASALAATVLGHYVDAGVIVAVTILNAIVGFLQEGKAERALAAIAAMISPSAQVLRDGRRRGVAVADLVPGDLVLIEAGDRVPADLRLTRASQLLIDEAILTGESVAAAKAEQPAAPAAALGERQSMAFSGTLVAAGQGSGIVTATGLRTEIGRISSLIGAVPTLTTPLLRQIDRFGRRLTVMIGLAALALFLYAVLLGGHPWAEALIAVVALAVGVVPEGLPAVMTITLAIGVQRMAARHAVVRRLPAVETIGATSVICTDKTGTLTRNEMTARHVVTAGGGLAAGGAGYAPEGGVEDAAGVDDAQALAAALPLIRAGLLCNDAVLRYVSGHWRVEGDPMEGALVTLAAKAGLEADHIRREWPRLAELPFDARHRFMATVNRGPGGEHRLLVKGAPEQLLDLCLEEAGPDGAPRPIDRAFWQAEIERRAAEGERVLGFCAGPADAAKALTVDGIGPGLRFLGLVGFIDPPRPEAVAAIAECRSAGIAVKMITGDHAATAGAIARQLGLDSAGRVMTGAELDAIPDAALAEAVAPVAVFARTSPEHKLRIVRALQAQGAIVAMTGDGVNDAPSLKQADVGIAMGHKGTEAAKEAAQIVLLDDNFASIVAAVHEGRTVYDNIRKVIAWTLPTNGGEALAVIAAILLGFTMPMSAVQILWINLATTVTLGLVLAFEPPEPGVMARRPRDPAAGLLSAFMLWRVVFVSVLFLAGSLGVFFAALAWDGDLALARTLVVNLIVVFEVFYLFNIRYLHGGSITLRGLFGTPAVLAGLGGVILAQAGFTYLPVMQDLFGTRPVGLVDGLMVIGAGVALMLVLEVEKYVLRRYRLFGQG
ncbi:HAD-IC family P-type ATPase [Zavarzinia compransoris]|uniref:Carbonate dehydratase n=1 Tax=Zavarzinia compransoris TaxID=1264899 RepID=A0A317E293_9PROT|nr:HAD-IC family P-type ATPase [Zavarzinia compransoris]PWR20732.1 carbonate dehydratase [Zavarzinia compransoris]TDP44436.1 potassium/sodium efflux P-type ATPase [Zavarzinia compransoris]